MGVLVSMTLGVLPRSAHALQPLETFVASAAKSNNSSKEAAAAAAQSAADADSAFGQALPSVTARGIVSRSQLQPQFPGQNGQPAMTSTLIPQNIYLVNVGITVPINVGAWESTSAANASARAAHAAERAANLGVERDITRAYYDVVGSEAVVLAAKHRLDLATKNAEIVRATEGEGEASLLDVERTKADVAHSEGDVADAENNLLKARRVLRSASGVEPEPGTGRELPNDDLHEEPPLAAWTNRNVNHLPAVEQAAGSREAAEKSLTAAKANWLPTLSASASENYTNATENLGRRDFYTLLGVATWKLDLSIAPTVRSRRAVVDAAKAMESQAKLDAEDGIYYAWLQVRTDLQKVKSARVESAAALRTADLARERFMVGSATQIDVLQAQQNYLQAEVARIRVDADLAYARIALRLSVADGKKH